MRSKLEVYDDGGAGGTTTLFAHSIPPKSARTSTSSHRISTNHLDASTATLGGVTALCAAGGLIIGAISAIVVLSFLLFIRMHNASQIVEERVQLIDGVGLQLTRVSRDGQVRSRCVLEMDELQTVFLHEGLHLCRVVAFVAVSLSGGQVIQPNRRSALLSEQDTQPNGIPDTDTDTALPKSNKIEAPSSLQHVLLFQCLQLSLPELQRAYSCVYDWLEREREIDLR